MLIYLREQSFHASVVRVTTFRPFPFSLSLVVLCKTSLIDPIFIPHSPCLLFLGRDAALDYDEVDGKLVLRVLDKAAEAERVHIKMVMPCYECWEI